MKYKTQTALAKLLLAFFFFTLSNSDLNAQRGGGNHFDFFHNSYGAPRQNHPFYAQPAPPTIWQSPSSPLGFHRKDNILFPANPQTANLPRSTRPHTREEWGLLNFNPEYLAAYASRLEKSSGASLEALVADRDALLNIADDIKGVLIHQRDTSSGTFEKVRRAMCQNELDRLDNAVYALHLEREAFVKEAYATYNQLFNKKKPVLDKLVTNLNKKLQDESYTDDTIEDLNKHYAELKSLSERIKTNSELLFRAPGANPDYIAAQNACKALRSTINTQESDFKNNLELYNQKKTVLDSLLADLNKKVEEENHSDEDYENLNTVHEELTLLFEKTKILGSFFGQDPKKHADYIAAEKMLTAAQKHIEESHKFYENSKYGEILEFEADTPYIAQELNNFNSIFLGEQAPHMEAFNNLMSAFMGKEGSSGAEAASSIPLDPSMQGDYILSSFKYQDDKADVYMEVARVIKVDECQMPYPGEDFSWDNSPAYALSLNSINVSEQNKEVTFAFQRKGEKFFLQSDVNSIKNYVAQKKIEGYIFLDPTLANTPSIDLNTIPTYGLKDRASAFGREFVSALLDFLPLISSSKSITELLYGVDTITGQPIPRIVSVYAIVGSLVPVPGAAKAGKFVGRGANVAAKVVDQGIAGVTEILTRAARDRPGTAVGGEALLYIKEGETWLRGTAGNAAKIPGQIADKLRNMKFRNLGHFRRTFWKEVAKDPVLSKSFPSSDIVNMKTSGIAPRVNPEQLIGKMTGYQLHHIKPIHSGGKVYDIDNLLIVTPRFHKEVLPPDIHYGKK